MKTNTLTFAELREANRLRQQAWPGSDQADTAFRALEVVGEAGEVAEAVKKFLRLARGIHGSNGSVAAIASELGDVVIAADLLAAHLQIDLGAAVRRKFNTTSAKYKLPIFLALKGAAS